MEMQLSRQSANADTIAHNVYNFPEYQNNKRVYLMACRYILQTKEDNPNPIEVIAVLKNLFPEALEQKNAEILLEIADIVNQFSPVDGELFLNILREHNMVHRINRLHMEHRNEEKEDNIYNDRQNVHDTKINKSVLQISKHLVSMYYRDIKDDVHDLILNTITTAFLEMYPYKSDIIKNGIDYIKHNIATFGINTTLADVTKAIWLWIHDNKPYQNSIYDRFIEELEEMNGYCSTGHLARLINIIQGFTDDSKLHLQIDTNSQCKAVVSHYLNTVLSKCTDEDVLDGIVSGNNEFKSFVQKKIIEKINEWEIEYGKDFINNVIECVNTYSNITIFQNKSELYNVSNKLRSKCILL